MHAVVDATVSHYRDFSCCSVSAVDVVKVAGNPPYRLRSCLCRCFDYVCQQSPMIASLDAIARGSTEHSSP
jgi:hypothetical protein